jgi:hypothetical protein
MNSAIPRVVFHSQIRRFLSLFTLIVLFAAPLSAQQPATAPVKPSPAREAVPKAAEPTFDTLLAADSYKLYGEVRNVGQLLSNGGAGEIVEPITKLADPPKEFKAIVKFLKTNAETLATSRLLFAAWPARTGIPNAFVAIEFSTAEEAVKFAPKLETFLPNILPPVPIASPEKPPDRPQAKPSEPKQPTTSENEPVVAATPGAPPPPAQERLPFVITHSGNLVFISDTPFKFEKIHPPSSKSLAEDQNFRVAHDRFSAESIFIYFNVALEEHSKPQSKNEAISEAEAERLQQEEQAKYEAQMARNPVGEPSPAEPPVGENTTVQGTAVLDASPPAATPKPTADQQARAIASSNIGHLLDLLGLGEPQWPEAVGVALALDNDEYVIRAILVEPQNAKRLPLPFVPQLISGPAYMSEAPSVLPDDTEVFVSASIDFPQTYEGMRQQAEARSKITTANAKLTTVDPFADFEKKAGFKIKEDLLPVLGNEIAIAGSLKTLQGIGPFGMPPPSAKPSPEAPDSKQDQSKTGSEVFPMLLIGIKDRDAARHLMPHVLAGLGIGEANLIAQTERREDTEMVNYAGVFAYALVGNFLIVSDAATVRRAIDANLNHQTLASNNAFRNFRRWQPRQILGEIYISPALMDSYREEFRKQSATLDPAMRDFLLKLSPTSEAITYALANEGFGSLHELHLPKNLIITMVAGISATTKQTPPEMNEAVAMSAMRVIFSAEETYKATAGDGSYGTLDKLVEQKLLTKDMLEKYGYKIDLTISGEQFEATAIPAEYGKTGKRSFFVDQSGVVRGDDHGGGPATIADKPIQ